MKKPIRIYTTELSTDRDVGSQSLIRRWSDDDVRRIKDAINSNQALPQVFPPIEVIFAGRSLRLDDLRGINLSGTKIDCYDLAYCAFDFSNLDECTFTATDFQYSRLVMVSMQRAVLSNIQASPIDARNANLTGSTLSRCYISNSDLRWIVSNGVRVSDCDFTESTSRIGNPAKTRREKARIKQAVESMRNARERLRSFNFKNTEFSEIVNRLLEHPCANLKKDTTHYGTVVIDKRDRKKIGVEVEVAMSRGSTSCHRVYSIKAAEQSFRLGDAVEIVKFESPKNAKQVGGRHFVGLVRPKMRKAHEGWMINRVIDVEKVK